MTGTKSPGLLAEWLMQLGVPGRPVCAPDRCLNGVVCYAPACYGTADYARADGP